VAKEIDTASRRASDSAAEAICRIAGIVLAEGPIRRVARRFEVTHESLANLIASVAGLRLGRDSRGDRTRFDDLKQRRLDVVDYATFKFQPLLLRHQAVVCDNTVYGEFWWYRLISAPNSELKNNICARPSSAGVVIESGNLPAASVDNNPIWTPNATVGTVGGSAKTWSQWQAFGYDMDGDNAHPKFANTAGEIFTLQSTSPATDMGAALSQVSMDKNGTARPKINMILAHTNIATPVHA
jgi:hypothetical protein